ncbi:LysR substrate-binding domain-containing protein [Aliivibrio logei]|uniref:LysR family transcriptional regulator n=1 Tax=Aliivibrio logei TaxID=688 RepID=UPI0035C92F13
MDINKLVTLLPDMAAFVTVVESESFSKAAQVLDMTPSGVSRQVSRLENALEVKLLERTTRKQTLTVAGQETYNYCKNIVDTAKEVIHASDRNTNKVEGYLRIATPKAFGRQVLQPILLEFIKTYPNIKLKVKVTDQPCDPIHDNLDLIFKLTNKPQENLVAKKLDDVDLILCATPEYLKQKGIPCHPMELSEHDCLYLGETIHDNEWQFLCGSNVFKVTVEGRFIVNHTEMRLDAVMHNLGIGVFPNFVVEERIKNRELIEVLPDWKLQGNYHGDIIMQFLRSNHMPNRLRVFIDFITQHFKK